MKNRVLPIVFIIIILSISVSTMAFSDFEPSSGTLTLIGRPTRLADEAESFFRYNLSVRQPLRNLYLKLRTGSGQHELNGIYLADDSLVERFVPTEDASIHKRNTAKLLEFAQSVSAPVAAVLLPTSSAIYQDKLPPYAAEIQFNQHGYIEKVNDSLTGTIAALNVYPELFAARGEYIYYRTANELTSRGGYLVYRSLANRLGLSPYDEAGFHQQFLATPYYGDLYSKWGYGGVKGDFVTLYHPIKSDLPLFTVNHWLRFEEKTYHTLYPAEAALDGNPMNMLLGGHSPRITITNHSLNESFGKLLVLGDRNALGILPFMSLHYSQTTLADPDLLTDSELASIDPGEYDQIIFIFSLDRYMNSSQPARAATAGSGL